MRLLIFVYVTALSTAFVLEPNGLSQLKGTCFLFYGDSILRQVYHSLIHSVIRKMPVVIDPVYGFASYRLSLPNNQHAYDSFAAVGKLSSIGGNIEASAPYGWNTESGIEMIYSFQQACGNFISAIQKLKASNMLKRKARVILVFNIGATNVLGTAANMECLRSTLPRAISSISMQLSRSVRHHVVMMNQPVAQTRLRALSPETFNDVRQSIEIFLSKLNGSSFNPSLLDFKEMVDISGDVPILEDDLHFGCMWGSVGRGRMSHPWGSSNRIGYVPAYVRGLHLKPTSSCGLVCSDQLLKDLASKILSCTAPTLTIERHFHDYRVDSCIDAYAHIPCPLYPGFSPAQEWGSNWVQFSTTAEYLVSHEARNRTYHDLLASRLNGFKPEEQSKLFEGSLKEFNQGGFEGCRKAPEYVRFVDKTWCSDALEGPGGSLMNGTWCALPSKGCFSLNNPNSLIF